MSGQSFLAGVPVHDYTAAVRMSDNPFQIPERKAASNTVKLIFNEYMDVPQTKEKQQCLIVKTPDSLKRQSDSERPSFDQERQNTFDNSLAIASGTKRDIIWNNQCEGYLRVPDELNLIQGSEFVIVKEGEAEGQEDEDGEDDDADEEENV
ncbi:uncharacterized protein LOC124278468 isoform X1 [Haliotis rubra]|uniref:uncharacterized protein LOC124278468 isoform X1 n=1 Tax=Haliotis rubra TaxID=36100 RepID=UPI001EE58FC8|nr:uncharacterized protein LOC124278468 isoform X1 [Haliotis rubra]